MEDKLKKELEELKSDERLYYEAATVFANAPLALIQYGKMAQINLIEKLLGLETSSLPLKK